MIYSPSAAKVTWSIEASNGGMIYIDMAFKVWALVNRDFMWGPWQIRVELIPKKMVQDVR